MPWRDNVRVLSVGAKEVKAGPKVSARGAGQGTGVGGRATSDCGYYEKRGRPALWPAGSFLWGGQSRILLFITRNIKLPTLYHGAP